MKNLCKFYTLVTFFGAFGFATIGFILGCDFLLDKIQGYGRPGIRGAMEDFGVLVSSITLCTVGGTLLYIVGDIRKPENQFKSGSLLDHIMVVVAAGLLWLMFEVTMQIMPVYMHDMISRHTSPH